MAQGVNLNSLQELEREVILQVLYRDRAIQNIEDERIRKLKTRLQHLRWRGTKNVSQENKEKSCPLPAGAGAAAEPGDRMPGLQPPRVPRVPRVPAEEPRVEVHQLLRGQKCENKNWRMVL